MREETKIMIEHQLIPRGISDKRVLPAIGKVDRRLFVPHELANYAYDDRPLPIGEGQTISQPYMVAVMTELLQLSGTEKVLEIGTGSGYQTALLAELAAEVYTLERIQFLSEKAANTLQTLGYKNVHFVLGDGTLGYPDKAPYDRIIVTAAAGMIPPPLISQLHENGRLIMPVGSKFSQVLTEAEKIPGGVKITEYGGCFFVPLIGKYGL